MQLQQRQRKYFNRMDSLSVPYYDIQRLCVCVYVWHMDGYDSLDMRNASMLYVTYNGDVRIKQQCHGIVACSSMRCDGRSSYGTLYDNTTHRNNPSYSPYSRKLPKKKTGVRTVLVDAYRAVLLHQSALVLAVLSCCCRFVVCSIHISRTAMFSLHLGCEHWASADYGVCVSDATRFLQRFCLFEFVFRADWLAGWIAAAAVIKPANRLFSRMCMCRFLT